MRTQRITVQSDEQARVRAHTQRLRAIRKRLVIDIGYLEACVESDPNYSSKARAIATCLNAAVDILNE